MRLLLMFALFISVAPFAHAQPAAPSLEDIRTIERQIVMPTHAFPKAEYVRLYAPRDVDGRRMIMGVFIHHTLFDNSFVMRPRTERPMKDVYIVNEDELPMIADGGCSVITVMFDLSTHSLAHETGQFGDGLSSINARCNGIA